VISPTMRELRGVPVRRLGLVLLLVGCVAGSATAQQTNCRSYYVGNVLYTSCDGQPGRPAGIDPSIYQKLNPPPKIDGPLDWMLKAEALKTLRLQNEAAAAARASAANPAPPPVVPAPPPAVPPPGTTAASEAVAGQLLAGLDGSWWLGVRRLADKGDTTALMSRLTVVRGILAGFDMSLIVQSSSVEDYNQRYAKAVRSDLTFEQIMAKVDGYYAEPSQIDKPLGLAVLLAVKPLEKR
jgi:hypothetical protein